MRWGEKLVATHKMSCPALLIVTCLPGSGINVRPQDLLAVCPFLTFPLVLSQIFQFSSFQDFDQPAKPFTTVSLYMFSPGHLSLQLRPPGECPFSAVPSSPPDWGCNTA